VQKDADGGVALSMIVSPRQSAPESAAAPLEEREQFNVLTVRDNGASQHGSDSVTQQQLTQWRKKLERYLYCTAHVHHRGWPDPAKRVPLVLVRPPILDGKCVFCVFWDELETLCILCILDELCSLDGKCVFCIFWDESETLCTVDLGH
jgi:hypothetical protein